MRNAKAGRLCDWLTNHDRSGKIYSGIYKDEELIEGKSDCCLPPTPVYFLEDSRRFYELLSPVLLLLSLTVLQLWMYDPYTSPVAAISAVVRLLQPLFH
ncbi:hypothetical protein LAZ67_13000376 [Cordylochernes scorpioides]|uniref:Uncharacterized protein n=1 Tax=Cordylochernes scorpioides TaxID=51811 RepID=A0ABY6L7Q6_9ARAC|nr:hypothetical protein LAZ67_13000376 [Cordylochernes scorpioides]